MSASVFRMRNIAASAALRTFRMRNTGREVDRDRGTARSVNRMEGPAMRSQPPVSHAKHPSAPIPEESSWPSAAD